MSASDSSENRLARRASGFRVPRLHLLTDDDLLDRRDFGERAEALLTTPGLDPHLEWTLHLRGPRTPAARLYGMARALTDAGFSARLSVNDRVDIAAALNLPGVHLGQRSLSPVEARALVAPTCRIGVSVHGPGEAAAARRHHADYIMAGHVFSTPSHDSEPRGVGMIVHLAEQSTPVIAVGGISPARVGVLLRAGAHGVAILRGVWDAPDPVSALSEYLLRLPPTHPDVP